MSLPFVSGEVTEGRSTRRLTTPPFQSVIFSGDEPLLADWRPVRYFTQSGNSRRAGLLPVFDLSFRHISDTDKTGDTDTDQAINAGKAKQQKSEKKQKKKSNNNNKKRKKKKIEEKQEKERKKKKKKRRRRNEERNTNQQQKAKKKNKKKPTTNNNKKQKTKQQEQTRENIFQYTLVAVVLP